MQECASCGTRYRLNAERDRILHFRLMPELACLYTVCPACNHPYIGYYGDNHQILAKHVDFLRVYVYSVPTEDMIEGFRDTFGVPWCDPRELTLDDLKEVRKFRDQMNNPEALGEVLDAWIAE